MNDKIKEWLVAKYILDHDPEAFDGDYVGEERDNLIMRAEEIFKQLVNQEVK